MKPLQMQQLPQAGTIVAPQPLMEAAVVQFLKRTDHDRRWIRGVRIEGTSTTDPASGNVSIVNAPHDCRCSGPGNYGGRLPC